jgi:hypothetical protein
MPEYIESLGHSRFDTPGKKTIDPNVFSQGVMEAVQMLRTAGLSEGVEDIITNCHKLLYNCLNQLTAVSEAVKKSLGGSVSGGESVDAGLYAPIGDTQNSGMSDEFEMGHDLAKSVIPQLTKAFVGLQNIQSYLGSSKAPPDPRKIPVVAPSGGSFGKEDRLENNLLTSVKRGFLSRIATKQTSVIDPVATANDLYQFAKDSTYFVTTYEGLKALCSFRDGCKELENELKKLRQ